MAIKNDIYHTGVYPKLVLVSRIIEMRRKTYSLLFTYIVTNSQSIISELNRACYDAILSSSNLISSNKVDLRPRDMYV